MWAVTAGTYIDLYASGTVHVVLAVCSVGSIHDLLYSILLFQKYQWQYPKYYFVCQVK